MVRASARWTASELDLTGAADVEDVADRVRDVESNADVSVLFVESDDAYLVIVRVDDDGDIRVFGSDSAFAEESRLGALLLGEIGAPAVEIDDAPPADEASDESPASVGADPDTDPVGDADLLADLGVPGRRLLELCGQEGMMPADVTAEVCQMMGCGDEIEELRET